MELRNAILVAVMGATGSGKTTFVNLASNSDLEVGHALRSCTSEVQLSQAFMVDGRPVVLIDTPGFDDSTKTEAEVLQSIIYFLVGLHVDGKKLSGIIFLHRISDDRMGGIAIKNFSRFRRICGESSLRNVLIATNKWNTVIHEVGERREHELATSEDFFKPALDNGARLVRHNDTLESAHEIIRQVLHLPPVVLRVQEQIVDADKNLSQTDIGIALDGDLKERAHKLQVEVEVLQREMQGLQQTHAEELEEIKKERDQAGVASEQLKKQMEDLEAAHAEELKELKRDQDETEQRLVQIVQARDDLHQEESDTESTTAPLLGEEILMKVLIIGSADTGKSCLFLRFGESRWNPNTIASLRTDLKVRNIELDGKRIKLQMWDTAGQERFMSVTASYYREAMGVLLVYDVTSKSSFDEIRTWHDKILEHAPEGVSKIIIGNKMDFPQESRVITEEQGRQLADELGAMFTETSAKDGRGVREAFLALARDIMSNERLQPARTGVQRSTSRSAVTIRAGPGFLAKPRQKCCG